MQARVYYSGVFWYGEVYADWLLFGNCWRNVTHGCFTKTGAIVSLKLWLKKILNTM